MEMDGETLRSLFGDREAIDFGWICIAVGGGPVQLNLIGSTVQHVSGQSYSDYFSAFIFGLQIRNSVGLIIVSSVYDCGVAWIIFFLHPKKMQFSERTITTYC